MRCYSTGSGACECKIFREAEQIGLPAPIDCQPGWCEDGHGRPVQWARDAHAFRTPTPRFSGDDRPRRSTWAWREGQWEALERAVDWTALPDSHSIISPPVAWLCTRFEALTKAKSALRSPRSNSPVKKVWFEDEAPTKAASRNPEPKVLQVESASDGNVILGHVHATWLCGKCEVDGSCSPSGAPRFGQPERAVP